MAPQPTKESVPKKVNLLDESDSDDEDGGADIAMPQLKVNEEYAKRFEHNKKREEMHRLEEKFKKTGKKEDNSDDDSSSSDETEDEDGFLATEDLDAQISATLSAIKNKDPRLNDKDFTFFKETTNASEPTPSKKKEKPIYLKDYHREKILAGGVGESDSEDDAPPKTYAQEQDALKKSIVSEINKAAESDEEEGDFVTKKPGQEKPDFSQDGVHPERAVKVYKGNKKSSKKAITEEDIANADKDPELFLSNFMAARAWAEGGEHNWKAFDSDDGDDGEGELADKFEEAYNLRFEDPEKSNQALKTYSREIVNARTVRKEAASSRKKAREAEKERKEEEKRQRKEDRARLRKLKLEEAEEKLKKIKQAAGLSGKELAEDEWLRFLNDAWEDDKWEDEMKRRFGEEYYAEVEAGSGSDDEDGDEGEDKKKKRKRPKKPTWDDDIDIKDIIPDFKDEEQPNITLSDDEGAAEGAEQEDDDDDEEDEDGRPSKKRKTSKDIKKERLASKKAAKAERAKLEALVDAKMDLDVPEASSSSSKTPEMFGFRYRETSPTSFGMTARDILLAPSDAALNSYVGLKKLAPFRDEEKKRKDKKRLSKKDRIRKWRRENFGPEYERSGPTFGFEDATFKEKKKKSKKAEAPAKEQGAEENVEDGGASLSKKRKRSRGKKKEGVVAEE
ncbi:hypothetical protein CkaCkLH20_05008 [Colletotrichum karsti]|uniref:Kri1-like C-terminal domain-containing protein n=1 Tax=Colletotrichum karsti TaxID=1095194 RepID=A0A9P6I6K4_9PEZI|nr:uncharacterized protein CkaCkLH20_05008 [Colletotrichum karsti]KAF9877308.1 hypothetical protein CkaCkLH20_05008 [Colletotrichum karsti]